MQEKLYRNVFLISYRVLEHRADQTRQIYPLMVKVAGSHSNSKHTLLGALSLARVDSTRFCRF